MLRDRIGPAPVAVVAYATLDINPSVELEIDADQRVQAARGRNDEGKLLVSGLTVRGMPLDDAVPALVDRAAQLGFIRTDGRSAILLTYTPVSDAAAGSVSALHREELRERIAAKLQARRLSALISLEEAPAALRQQAQQNGLSPNQQRILNQARARGLQLDAKQLREQPLSRALEQAGATLEYVLGLPQRLTPAPGSLPNDPLRRGAPESGQPGSSEKTDGAGRQNAVRWMRYPCQVRLNRSILRPPGGQPSPGNKLDSKPENAQETQNGPAPPAAPQQPRAPIDLDISVPSLKLPPFLPDNGRSSGGSSDGNTGSTNPGWR